MRWWRGYWFGAGGRYSAAALRIAVGLSVLWLLYQLRAYASAPAPGGGAYRPIGILRLLPFVPGPAFLQVTWLIATAATLTMILGLRSRLATVISLAAALVICSHEYTRADHWSHDLNASLLAQLALLGARTGDAWSIDAWWRRRRGQPAASGHAYQWSVRLVQLSLAIMMASAGFSKLVAGGMSLDWALSDNLRHQIMVRFDLAGLPRTDLAEWVLVEPVRWKAAALLNIGAQLAPLAAVILIDRPWVRATCGAIFAAEVLGLRLMMGFWDPWWFPLIAAFVDWDRLVGWWRARRGEPAEPAPAAPVAGRTARVFVGAYVAVYAFVAFWHWPLVDQRLNAYPFTAFPMFASIRAVPPYDTHRRYEFLEGGAAVTVPAPAPALERWIAAHRGARKLLRPRSADAVRAHLEQLRAEAGQAFPELPPSALRVIVRALRSEPHPAPARFDRIEVATIGELAADGSFTHRLGRLTRAGGRWAITGLPPGTHQLATYRAGAFGELVAVRDDERWLVELPAGPVVVVARHAERWFLVGDKRR